MRIIRHLMVWSSLMATFGVWIAPIPRSGDVPQTSTAEILRQAAHDFDELVIRPAPSLVFARIRAGAAALGVLAISHRASTSPHPIARFAEPSDNSHQGRVPLYNLFRVYRI